MLLIDLTTTTNTVVYVVIVVEMHSMNLARECAISQVML